MRISGVSGEILMVQMTESRSSALQNGTGETRLVLEPVRAHSPLPSLLLADGRYTLGSAENCTVRLQAVGVEPEHCVIESGPKGIFLSAESSRIWHNKNTVKQTQLWPGDQLTIGPVEFRIRTATREDLLRIVPEKFSREVTEASSGCSPLATEADAELRLLLSGLRKTTAPENSPPPRSRGWNSLPPLTNATARRPTGDEPAPEDLRTEPVSANTSLEMEFALLREQRNRMDRRERELAARCRKMEERERRLTCQENLHITQEDVPQIGLADRDEVFSVLAGWQRQLEVQQARLEEEDQRLTVRLAGLDARQKKLDRDRELLSEHHKNSRQALHKQAGEAGRRESELYQAAEELQNHQALHARQLQELNQEHDRIAEEQAMLAYARAAHEKQVEKFEVHCRVEQARLNARKVEIESEESQLIASRHQLDADRSAFDQDRLDWERRMQKLALAEQNAEVALVQIADKEDALWRDKRELEHNRQKLLKREAELQDAAQSFESSRAALEAEQKKQRAKAESQARQFESEREAIQAELKQLIEIRQELNAVSERLHVTQLESAAERDHLETQWKAVESAKAELEGRKNQLEAEREDFGLQCLAVNRRQEELDRLADQIRQEDIQLAQERAELARLRNDLRRQLAAVQPANGTKALKD